MLHPTRYDIIRYDVISEWNQVMANFRTGRVRVLVATDVAARGLDIKDIDTVVNYDFPPQVG